MTAADCSTEPRPIRRVLDEMQTQLDLLPPAAESRRPFLATYLRTTVAVSSAIDDSRFADPGWVEELDIAFAELYLKALSADLSGRRVARPWALAFGATASLPALRHVLLGINAHINYDLPQALLAVISDAEFDQPTLLDRRRADHEQIDAVLSSRVAAEDAELAAGSGRALLDRLLQPLNRASSRRFLREARAKVWHNTLELQRARLSSPQAYAVRLAELELLSAAKIADLLAPGQVLLRLAAAGFGVLLPPAQDPGGASRTLS